jgi:hypothetical protein
MNRAIYLVTFVISLLISTWIAVHNDVINLDAICYLTSAEVMNTQGFSAGMHVCSQANWPFYSFLIAKINAITHLPYVTVAYGLNALFAAISATLFVAIVAELGGGGAVLWLAAAVILCSHEFGNVRQYIVRDHGYFAAYLTSLFLLLRYVKVPHYKTALLFSASLVVATLFRVEGIIFLILLPFVVLFNTTHGWRERAIQFIQLNTLPLFGVVIGVVLIILIPDLVINKMGRLPEVANQLQHGVSMVANQFLSMKKVLAEQVLNQDSARDTGIVLFLMMVSWYLISVMSNLSWIYSLLLIYGWIKQANPFLKVTRPVVYAYLGINLVITIIFLLERLFLSSRYLVGLTLILMLWLPFIINTLIASARSIRRYVALTLIVFFVGLSAASGIVHFGYSKAYISDAAEWLSLNVQPSQRLYANDLQLMYHSKHYGLEIFKQVPIDINAIKNHQWEQYDYVALRSSVKDEEKTTAIVDEMQLQPVKVFMNKRGDKVSIYQIPRKKTS